MKSFLFFLLIALAPVCFAQDNEFTASGKIVDSAGQPLSGASVFAQNTTLGTITNSEGFFRLKLPNGGYDLIISYTGYETQQIRISSSSTTSLDIAMKPKDKTLQEAVVVSTGEVPDGLAKYGKFFSDRFIGTTPASAECKIDNPEALQFFYSKKRNRLKVKAKENLVISNNYLGYKIKYQLDSFAYEYGSDVSVYTGFPFFEEMAGTDEQKALWATNRKKAYLGSRLHFVRSWHDSSLAAEGYVIEKVDSTSKDLKTYPIENPYDTTIFNVVDDKDVEILYNGKMRVIYRNEMPEPTYLSQNKIRNTLRSQITIIDISEGIVIQQNGYFYEQNDVTNTGYWGWEKIADMVPFDYRVLK